MRPGKHRVEVYFNSAEYADLQNKVCKTSLTASEFIRRSVKGASIKEAPPADVPYLLREFKRIGNNINQILLIAHTNGFLDTPRLRSALDELKEADRLVFRTYAGKDQLWQ